MVSWTASVVAPGENHDFWPHASGNPASSIIRIPEIVAKHQFLVLAGTMKDAAGTPHRIDERFDVREWWQLIVQAGHNLDKDWAEESAKHLKEIAEELRNFNSERRNERRQAYWTWRDRIGWWRDANETRLRSKIDAVIKSLRR